MIVGRPRVTTAGDEVRLEAEVAVERRPGGFPPSLWFAFPRPYQRFVEDGSDAFAAALVPLAMSLGETLRVEGEVSCRLAAGLRDYQRIQAIWKPETFRVVGVEFGSLRRRRRTEASGGVAIAFSGGVDSFHTLWTHLPDNEPYPASRVTHCLMVDGFDVPAGLAETGSFRALRRLYAPVMAAHGVELVTARTNLLEFLGVPLRAQAFAAFLTAPALVLGGLFSRFAVSAGARVTDMGMFRDGSHLMLDHLLSTETTETCHEGAHLTRLEKTLAIAAWPDVFDRLRVCFNSPGVQEGRDAVANCCACEKCLRTMVTLELAGALGKFACFPRPLTRRAVRGIDFASSRRDLFVPEIVAYAEKVGRRDVARDLRTAMFRSVRVRAPIRRVVAASFRAESGSRAWAAVAGAGKRALKRVGFGRGWLY